MARPAVSALALLVTLVGCTSEPENPDPTYYADVKPLLDAYCVGCHSEGGVAPFRLDTYEHVLEVANAIPRAIESRSMPPFLAAPAVRPLRYDTSLTGEQIVLISRWVGLGAPMGDPASEGAPIELPERALDRVDTVLSMPQPYSPTTLPDEYRCFVLDWEETEDTYITGVQFMPGNLAIAHHAVIYLVDEEDAGIIDAANGADGNMGYSCFGGATPDGEPSFPTKLVAGWGPGVDAIPYPDGSGALVRPGTRVVLQMHYSILNDGTQPDLSSVAFEIEREVAHNAGYLPFLNIEWPSNPDTMLIPAGMNEVTHEYVADPTQSPLLDEFVPGADASEGLVVYSVLPHLHKLGTSISIELERADGTVEPMVDIGRWDFDWQGEFEFEQPITVFPGDQLRMTCNWDNSARNQPVIQGRRREPEDVRWGEGTYDEMCASSLFVHGVSDGPSRVCPEGSSEAPEGRFLIEFDVPTSVRESENLEGELVGPVWGTIWNDDNVSLLGPRDGAEPVGRFTIDELDLREGPSAPIEIEVDLPAGDYQILGFMDTDGNAAETDNDPDLYDPVMIPARARRLRCDRQPITVSFPLLLPDR